MKEEERGGGRIRDEEEGETAGEKGERAVPLAFTGIILILRERERGCRPGCVWSGT